MGVASKNIGGILYDGPSRSYVVRWKHISTVYIIKLSVESYYLAQSLTNHPHYTILRNEFLVFNSLLTGFLKKNVTTHVRRISISENYQDDFLLVINNFTKYPKLRNALSAINDSKLLQEVLLLATLDINRGNCEIDFGYSTGQNLVRDSDDFGMTRPRLLDKTKEPVFLAVGTDLSVLVDLVCDIFSLPKFYWVDNFYSTFCEELHPRKPNKKSRSVGDSCWQSIPYFHLSRSYNWIQPKAFLRILSKGFHHSPRRHETMQ
jgi:hypothetical protein